MVGARGYHSATISQICASAGVSRRTFYSYFQSKEECYREAFDRIGQHLDHVMEEAANRIDGDWPAQVRARLVVLLETFAANPDLFRFIWIAPLRAGETISTLPQDALERLLRALLSGKPSANLRQASEVVEHSMAGGMMGLIASRVESGRGDDLPDLLPDLVELFLTPYLGRTHAEQVV